MQATNQSDRAASYSEKQRPVISGVHFLVMRVLRNGLRWYWASLCIVPKVSTKLLRARWDKSVWMLNTLRWAV